MTDDYLLHDRIGPTSGKLLTAKAVHAAHRGDPVGYAVHNPSGKVFLFVDKEEAESWQSRLPGRTLKPLYE